MICKDNKKTDKNLVYYCLKDLQMPDLKSELYQKYRKRFQSPVREKQSKNCNVPTNQAGTSPRKTHQHQMTSENIPHKCH